MTSIFWICLPDVNESFQILEGHCEIEPCPLEVTDGTAVQGSLILVHGVGDQDLDSNPAPVWRWPAVRAPSWFSIRFPIKFRFLARSVSLLGNVPLAFEGNELKYRAVAPSQVELVALGAQVFDVRLHCPVSTEKEKTRLVKNCFKYCAKGFGFVLFNLLWL